MECPSWRTRTRMSVPGPRHEHELLLCTARLDLSEERRTGARTLIRAGLDWSLLRAEAERHGLTLLLRRHLTSVCSDLCPPGFADALAARAHGLLAVNLALAGELTTLIPELEGAGCRPLVIKGPALAVDVFGDLSSRPFGDLDIVVDRAEVRRAWEVLVTRGYTTPHQIDPRWRDTLLRTSHEQLFVRPGALLHVDLHWELSAPNYSDAMKLSDVRPRLVRVRVGCAEVETLGPEDNLLFLCCHGTKHNWASLSWLVDVAELLRARPRLDWDHVMRWSRGPGRRRPIQLGLHLAHRLLEAPVPNDVLADGDRDPVVAELVGIVTEAFFDPSAAASRQGFWSQTFRSVRFRGMKQPSDRLRRVLGFFRPGPPDWELVSLPAWASPAYYAVHLVRLLREHGAAAFGFSSRAGRD
jgi:hypothetical protein